VEHAEKNTVRHTKYTTPALKILSQLPTTTSPYPTHVPLSDPLFLMISTYLASELNRGKIGQCDPRQTFQVAELNTSRATKCKHRLSVSPDTLKIDPIDVTELPCTGDGGPT